MDWLMPSEWNSIDCFHSSVAKPEQIALDSSDNNLIKHTSDLEIVHTYTLHNKGPSDAKRTEVKLMWPMMPLPGFNEQQPLLQANDLPSVIRVSDPKAKVDRCHIYQPVSLYTSKNDLIVVYFRQRIMYLVQICIIQLSIQLIPHFRIIWFVLILLRSNIFKIRLYPRSVMDHYVKVLFVILIHYQLVTAFWSN